MSKIAAVVDEMTRFATETKDDSLSVRVLRAAQRLQTSKTHRQPPLTKEEIATIRPFLRRVELDASQHKG